MNRDVELFGWYDWFNDCIYRKHEDAIDAENGGNKITNLYTEIEEKT